MVIYIKEVPIKLGTTKFYRIYRKGRSDLYVIIDVVNVNTDRPVLRVRHIDGFYAHVMIDQIVKIEEAY